MTYESVIMGGAWVSRRADRHQALRAERRQAILQAAIPLFATNGFSETGVSSIAQAAGVSHGTVFLYFATKEELFRAALLEPLADAAASFFQPRNPVDSPLTQIRQLVREHVKLMRPMESYLRLTQYVLGQQERFPDLAQALFAFSHELVALLVPLIQAGQEQGELAPGDPYAIAISYFCFVNGVRLVIMDASDEMWDQMVEMGVRLFGPTNLA